MLELDTPHGTARAHLHAAAEPRAALVLGHGAGGGVTAPDLVAATAAALAADGLRRARGAALPSPGAAFTGAGRAPRHRLDRDRRAAARRSAGRPAAPHGRPLVRRPRRLPHRRDDRSRRCRVPRVPAAPAGTAGRYPAGSRSWRPVTAPLPRRAGRGRSVRDPTSVGAANGRPRAGQPQPPQRQAGDRGGPGTGFHSRSDYANICSCHARRRSSTPTSTRSTRRSSSGTIRGCAAGR